MQIAPPQILTRMTLVSVMRSEEYWEKNVSVVAFNCIRNVCIVRVKFYNGEVSGITQVSIEVVYHQEFTIKCIL